MTDGHDRRLHEVVLRGIGVSPGVVIGLAYVRVDAILHVPEYAVSESDVEHEICRFENSLIETRRQIKGIERSLSSQTVAVDASILDAHLMVLDDRALIEDVINGIQSRLMNAESVVKRSTERYASLLASLEDDYLRERVADVRDVGRRIIRNLLGHADSQSESATHRHILIAHDLAPSDTANLDRTKVVGFAIDLGSPTSHTAVVARTLEIPAVVGLHDVSERVQNGDEILIDGNKGVLIINPSHAQLEEYGRVAEQRKHIEMGLTSLKLAPAETKDGHRITLAGNLEHPSELDAVLQYGAEGVGLFRSEYLFLSKDRVVSEDEQAEAYTTVAHGLAPHTVVIRTLDLGGDKFFPAKELYRESNPFLGCRSIRLSLLHPEHFKSQLRAILRSSDRGNVKIMYPMISNLGEVMRANDLLEESKDELRRLGVPFDAKIDVGVMVEIPAAAITADVLGKHVKFFSIGTNDLVQYTMAVDRINEHVAYLYQPTNPAVLRLIKMTIDAAHQNGIWVGVCGEMAADPLMTPLLLGLGVDELSMAPSAVPLVKDAIRSLNLSQARDLAESALKCSSAVEVLESCRELTRQVAPEILELI